MKEPTYMQLFVLLSLFGFKFKLKLRNEDIDEEIGNQDLIEEWIL